MSDNISSDDFDKLLDEFICNQLQETEDALAELDDNKKPTAKPNSAPSSTLDDMLKETQMEESLAAEERQLYKAYNEFIRVIKTCCSNNKIPLPNFIFNIEDILPRFRPSKTEQKLKNDIVAAWDVLLQAHAERLASLPDNATDEQILNFAEKSSDKNLQMALISYVETLIEVDSCEIAYNLRRAKYEKHKIEKRIIEEQQRHRERIKKYVAAIKEKNFPVDAEMLVNNFFKTYRKDPIGAQQVLEKNPATFAPIQIDKIPPRFFGMIKAKPEDGIKVNKKLGQFLKKLKA